LKKYLLITTAILVAGVSYIGYQSFFPVADKPAGSKISQCHFEPQMLLIQGGTFDMGAGAIYPEELPVTKRTISDFMISKYEITNQEFAQFTSATGYRTVAETGPNPQDYPNIPKEQLIPGSAVFVKLSEAVKAATFLNWWHFVEGANWQQPKGPGSDIIGKENYPVVHIAYADAAAYAKWKGHRLPTEAEYEFASRGGLNGKTYASGDTLKVDGKFQANTWQGLFPFDDSAQDGFEGLAPVGCYAGNAYGVHDLIGNVWEWTKSVYYPRHFDIGAKPDDLPPNGFDQRQPGVSVGVVKGGSYLCADDFCMRYRPAGRHAQDTGMGTSHIGFRTVKDI
jgi:formylglycine-generating enzyme required for sulfatase activity